MQPPKWFTNWSTEFEKRNNARFDRIENRLEKVEDRLDRHSEILSKHSEIFARNNLR